SLARPDGNLTGLTFFFAEICAKRVELIKEAIPSLKRVAVIVNPGNPATFIPLETMQNTASALQIELVPVQIKMRDDIPAAIAAAAAGQLGRSWPSKTRSSRPTPARSRAWRCTTKCR